MIRHTKVAAALTLFAAMVEAQGAGVVELKRWGLDDAPFFQEVPSAERTFTLQIPDGRKKDEQRCNKELADQWQAFASKRGIPVTSPPADLVAEFYSQRAPSTWCAEFELRRAPTFFFDFAAQGNAATVIRSVKVTTLEVLPLQSGGFALGTEVSGGVRFLGIPGSVERVFDKLLNFDRGAGTARLRLSPDRRLGPTRYRIDLEFQAETGSARTTVSTGPFWIQM